MVLLPLSASRASAPESAHQQRGESPLRAAHWLHVAEGNCVVERRGGEQPDANNQSIINKMMNSIRPHALTSLLAKGEAGDRTPTCKGQGNFDNLCRERNSERGHNRGAWGGWRWNGWKLERRESGIMIRERTGFMTGNGRENRPEDDRILIVVKKRGNFRGAKGDRKVEA